jgi:hypothetical protein
MAVVAKTVALGGSVLDSLGGGSLSQGIIRAANKKRRT